MSEKSIQPKVGFSIGDINGIGIEIILKVFQDQRLLELFTPIIFGNMKMLSFLKKTYESEVNFHGIHDLNQIIDGKINVFNAWENSFQISIGQQEPEAGKHAVLSLKEATKALKANQIDVLVTAPINKANTYSEEFPFPGHTEFLNQELDGQALMFMVSEEIKIALITDHVPLSAVSNHITKDLVHAKLQVLNQSLIKDFGIRKPKIAVLGLNPHSGDNGVIGTEDEVILKPVIKEAFDQGLYVFGPFPSDGFFGNQSYRNYDAVLSCYHDQGLIPFKTLSFGQGVNFTAGLNHIRTSPDHGTGYDIAGQGIANESSMLQAIYCALDFFKNRQMYSEITQNILKISKQKPSSKME
jgi:4-hydroxythreonine-4-phosphate dehydrogenase